MPNVPVSIAAAAAALVAALAAVTGRLTAPTPPVAHSQCVMAVGNFESGQFNQDSLFLVDSAGRLTPTKSVTVSTTAQVPPAYVNRNVQVCFNGAAVIANPNCVLATQAFYANERTPGKPGSVDTLLYVPPKGPLLDSLIRADSAPNGATLPQPADSFVAKPIQICPTTPVVPFRAVLGT